MKQSTNLKPIECRVGNHLLSKTLFPFDIAKVGSLSARTNILRRLFMNLALFLT